METLLDLTGASCAVVRWSSRADALAWLAEQPLSLHVCRVPGVAARPGQYCALVATFADHASQQAAKATLRNLTVQTRREYMRAAQAISRVSKLI